MSETTPHEENLSAEFRNLGKNLVDTLHAAWDSPESKRLQQELETGLTDLADTLRQEADTFMASPTGQQLKTDVEELHARVRSGEAESQIRTELVKALQTLNQELEKVARSWGAGPASATGETIPPQEADDAG
jgi:uncharacterized protein YukE